MYVESLAARMMTTGEAAVGIGDMLEFFTFQCECENVKMSERYRGARPCCITLYDSCKICCMTTRMTELLSCGCQVTAY